MSKKFREKREGAKMVAKATIEFVPDAAFAASVEAMLTGATGTKREEFPAEGTAQAYPLPSYALSVWLVGHELKVGIPGLGPLGQGHTISIPLAKCQVSDEAWGRGWGALLDMLKSQERAGRTHSDRRLGTKAAPVQHDVERALVRKFDSQGKQTLSFEELFDD